MNSLLNRRNFREVISLQDRKAHFPYQWHPACHSAENLVFLNKNYLPMQDLQMLQCHINITVLKTKKWQIIMRLECVIWYFC